MACQCEFCEYCKEHRRYDDPCAVFACHHPIVKEIAGDRYPILYYETDEAPKPQHILTICPYDNDILDETYHMNINQLTEFI